MRIDRLTVQNFKGFAERELEFPRRLDAPPEEQGSFHLLIGDNGSGKTSTLDALAVALGLWHKAAPRSGWRNILQEEIRLEPQPSGDRVLFEPRLPTRITATGRIGATDGLSWTRTIREGGTRTTNAAAREAEAAIANLVQAAGAERAVLPVLAYYGAGRTWLPTNKRPGGRVSAKKSQRLDAYHHCLDTRIRDRDVNEWFLFEAVAAVNGQGAERPGVRAVKQAVLACIPGADGLRYDSDLKEIVLSIGGWQQPFYNLSAGQRMMLALVADIAIKAVTLNSHLLGPEGPGAQDPGVVLRHTAGVVLIDELDVHLHPTWQRRVIEDLRRTFPNLQFIATSHSAFVVQTLRPGELVPLQGQPVAEFGNLGIETIARGLMGVERPDVSPRYREMVGAAKHYLLTLDEAAKAPADKLADFQERLAAGIPPYADNPAFQALLELEREARLGKAMVQTQLDADENAAFVAGERNDDFEV